VTTDTTDATFEQDVLARSQQVPVVVDLWAPWCGPCKTLGPIIERVIDETEGAVELVKVNIDENPAIAQAFQVQSIPAVFAIKDRNIVNTFVGAVPEQAIREFVATLTPQPSEADLLVEAGDEASLRKALELQPDHELAITGLAQLLIDSKDNEGALELLGRIPETPTTRHLSALARLNEHGGTSEGDNDIEGRLNELLERVKADDNARQEYLDLLESLPEDDERRTQFRRALSSRLF
jgi:putative thioredoxin